MYLSIWLGIVLAGGQSGCNSWQTNNPAPTRVIQERPAVPAPKVVDGRNPDFYQIPKVPRAGARVTYNSVPVNGPYVALTFDDGPHPVHTPRLLNILAEKNVKATFYVLGSNAKAYPAIIRRILAEGHEIGNHTWNHPALSKLTSDQVSSQMARTDQIVREVTGGYRMRTMRPPYGATNDRVKQQCYNQFGYPTILWSVDPEDWKKPGVSVVANRLVNGARSGGILLVHDIHESSISSMPAAVEGLLAKGFKFVTVSQLINLERPPALAAAPNTQPQNSVAPVPAAPGPILTTPQPAPTSTPTL